MFPSGIMAQKPTLEILVQPSSYADFRYVTEMDGHVRGFLQRRPKIKVGIHNYDGEKAIMRCYVVTANSNSPVLAPHVNGIISRSNKNQHYQEDTAFCRNNFEVEWNIAIIQSKDSDKERMLAGNKETMHQHKLCIAEESMDDIDPKRVRLYFHAFAENEEGLLEPVEGCGIISETINKQRDSKCGELSIYNMTQNTGSCTGGDELIVFAKNVSKKNTYVCFYDEQDWRKEMEGHNLTYLCSHAIKLLIPPYNTEIQKDTEVKVKIVRRNGSEESESVPFTYKPIKSGKRPHSYNNESAAAKKQRASGVSIQQKYHDLDIAASSTPAIFSTTENEFTQEWNCTITAEPSNIYVQQDLPPVPQMSHETHHYQSSHDMEMFMDIPNLQPVSEEDLLQLCQIGLDCNSQKNPQKNMKPLQGHKEKNEDTQCMAKVALSKLCDLMDHKRPSRLQELKEIIRAKDSDYGPLHTAALHGQTTTLDCLLKIITDCKQQKLINCLSRNGQIPLIIAVKENNVDCIKLLCKMKANVNIDDVDDNTALHVAATMKYHECLSILLSVEEVDISKTNRKGMNALHIAVTQGDLQSIKLLVEAGADINSKTKTSGQTALHMAVKMNSSDIVKYLLTQKNLDTSVPDFEQNLAQSLVQSNQDDIIQLFKEICDILQEQSNEVDTERSETEAEEDSEEENHYSPPHCS